MAGGNTSSTKPTTQTSRTTRASSKQDKSSPKSQVSTKTLDLDMSSIYDPQSTSLSLLVL